VREIAVAYVSLAALALCLAVILYSVLPYVWTRRCPICREGMQKDDALGQWRCGKCGWVL